MVCWTISECQKKRYCKMFTTVSWVSGVCWELKELIVWWFLCQSYQVHFGPKQSAHPCSLPHPHWPQHWGRGFGVEVPDSAIFPEYEMFFPCIILSSMTYSHQIHALTYIIYKKYHFLPKFSPNGGHFGYLDFSKYVFSGMYVGMVFWEKTISFMALIRKNDHFFEI